jgi:hypothetical protein
VKLASLSDGFCDDHLACAVGGYYPFLILLKIKVSFEMSEVGRGLLAFCWPHYRSNSSITDLNVTSMALNMISVCLMLSMSLPIFQFFILLIFSLSHLLHYHPSPPLPNSSCWQMEWISRRKFTITTTTTTASTTATWDGVFQPVLTQPPSLTHDKATLYDK